MTYPKLDLSICNVVIISTLVMLVSSCNNENKKGYGNALLVDTTESKIDNHLDSEIIDTTTISTQTSGINIETFSYEVMDSIRTQFRLKLDTGIKMYQTSKEEYLLLVKLKNELKFWIEQHCIDKKERKEFNETITELEESELQARMSLEDDFSQTEKPADWGNDKHMMIYGAGSTSLYHYLGTLLAKREGWCD